VDPVLGRQHLVPRLGDHHKATVGSCGGRRHAHRQRAGERRRDQPRQQPGRG
jgi:hypothetical protein